MSNPMDSEEDILFGGETTSPATGGSAGAAADDDDNWAPLPESPGDPLSAPPVEAAPAATAEPIMDPGVPVPPEKPAEEEPRPVARVQPPRQSTMRPAHVTGPRPRPQSLRSTLAPAIVAAIGLAVGAVMFLQFDNPPLAGVAALLGVIGALFTRVLLRESR